MENKTTMETYKELIIKMLEKIDSEEHCRQIYTVVKNLTEGRRNDKRRICILPCL